MIVVIVIYIFVEIKLIFICKCLLFIIIVNQYCPLFALIENGLSNRSDMLDKVILFVNAHTDKTLWNRLVFFSVMLF